MWLRQVWVALAVVGALECGQAQRSMAGDSCLYAFAVHVTDGPDKGRSYEGMLTIRAPSATTIAGTFAVGSPDAGAPMDVRVDGKIGAGQVTLTFHFPDGTTVTGSGPAMATGACPATTSGTATGPREGDTGDWGGTFLASACNGDGTK